MSFFGGRPITLTFTPPAAGTVLVSVIFDLVWDVGGGSAAAFCEQSSVVTYGERVGPEERVLQSFRVAQRFDVAGGSAVVVGLAAYGPGVRRMGFYNLSLEVQFIESVAPSPAPPAPPPSPPPSPPPPAPEPPAPGPAP